MGVRLLVCQPSLDLHGYTMDDMIEGVEMIGGAAFNDMACDADAVIAF
jgi:predicted peroxiredoxin